MKISLKFVPKGPINNIPSLVQIMAGHQPGDKPSSEPMMVSFMTYMRHSASMSLNDCNISFQAINSWQRVAKLLFRLGQKEVRTKQCKTMGLSNIEVITSITKPSWECMDNKLQPTWIHWCNFSAMSWFELSVLVKWAPVIQWMYREHFT